MATVVPNELSMLHKRPSGVKLHIPKSLQGLVMMYLHLDPSPFLEELSDNECLIAPVVECISDCRIIHEKHDHKFKMVITHNIGNIDELLGVKVRRGDIHKAEPFMEIPRDTPTNDPYYTVDEDHITIYTSHFCQFLCTVCRNTCDDHFRAYVSALLKPLEIEHSQLSSRSRFSSAVPSMILYQTTETNYKT